jgi:hypothetical protein
MLQAESTWLGDVQSCHRQQATRLRPDDPILELQEILADKDAFVSILPGARTLRMQGAHPVRDPAGRPEQNELT